MNTTVTAAILSALMCVSSPGQALQSAAVAKNPPLDRPVQFFELKDGSLVDALAELSSNSIVGLHLGIEEIVREKLSDPRDKSVRFSLHLENKTVREILDTICQLDIRYTWSTDGSSIDVYPRASIDDPLDLLNLRLEKIMISNIPDPDQALTPLARQLPREQVGYIQMGGENAYTEPWTATFEHLTVRQFINRIAEHAGSRSSWVWQGGKDSRMFTFLKGGFHTDHSDEASVQQAK
jgi:hypothetical protein